MYYSVTRKLKYTKVAEAATLSMKLQFKTVNRYSVEMPIALSSVCFRHLIT